MPERAAQAGNPGVNGELFTAPIRGDALTFEKILNAGGLLMQNTILVFCRDLHQAGLIARTPIL